jgi:hypothetical protein
LCSGSTDVNFIDSEDGADGEPIPMFWVFVPEKLEIFFHSAKRLILRMAQCNLFFDRVKQPTPWRIIYKEIFMVIEK